MKKYILIVFGAGLIFSGCEKKVDPVDNYEVTVDYRNNGQYGLTSDVELNPKDSITLDFTITSPTDMAFVEVQINGVRVDTFQLGNLADKRTFTKVKGYRVDSSAGKYTYRVLGRDSRAVFMGDGGKELTVTVKPDFYFWSYRILAVPDTVNNTNKCYYSTRDGKTYSKIEGAAVSSTIDFGYYFDISGTNGHTIYALSAPQSQIAFYDISSWTKNATVFKKMPTSINFVTNLRSSGAIKTLIGNNMASGTANKVSGLSLTNSGSTSNSVIGFKTAEGKFGCIQVRFLGGASAAKETNIQIDVKVQI